MSITRNPTFLLGILKSVKVHPQKYFVNERLLELLRDFRV